MSQSKYTPAEQVWVTAFGASMLISENDWKASIAVADAAEGAVRPKTVALPDWGTTLILDRKDGAVDVKLEGKPSPALLYTIMRDLW